MSKKDVPVKIGFGYHRTKPSAVAIRLKTLRIRKERMKNGDPVKRPSKHIKGHTQQVKPKQEEKKVESKRAHLRRNPRNTHKQNEDGGTDYFRAEDVREAVEKKLADEAEAIRHRQEEKEHLQSRLPVYRGGKRKIKVRPIGPELPPKPKKAKKKEKKVKPRPKRAAKTEQKGQPKEQKPIKHPSAGRPTIPVKQEPTGRGHRVTRISSKLLFDSDPERLAGEPQKPKKSRKTTGKKKKTKK